MLDQKFRSLPQPPPLGFPIPADRHAISVQLPTWADLQGMVAQDPRILQRQQIGYPRSFLNQNVVRVSDACLQHFGQPDENCLVFPAREHALACRALLQSLASDSSQECRTLAADFILDAGLGNTRRRFFLVLFPAKSNSTAMGFWRLTGTGISSRLAESLHAGLHRIQAVPLNDSADRPGLHRELANRDTDEIVKSRIVGLLKRGSTNPTHSAQFSPSDVYLYPSGMAAIYGLNKVLQAWMPEQSVVFGFSYELTLKLLEVFGRGAKFYGRGTSAELDQFAEYLSNERHNGRSVQSVWCECASNPLLRTVDLARLRRMADEYGFLLVVDDTIASFANVDLAGIADIIVTSLTKTFSGYANVLAGSIVLDPNSIAYPRLKQIFNDHYVNELFSTDSLILEHNSRDFLSRASRLNTNASALVTMLEPLAGTPSSTVVDVYYPSRCWSRPNYDARMRHATSEFTPGYGCLFTVEFESISTASAFFDALNIHKGPSLGTPVTIVLPYVQLVFPREEEKRWAASHGLREAIVRVSVGLEDRDALVREFRRALRVADKFKRGRESRGFFESVL
ncbi:cystathionine gamma-synthase [Dissoconium aciculare CBS 342.82]|uniref:Cystathionine gamma-synthase n=1 Tax=Dissoconium aciculare CBS 342.82 TaxID=1314786 RepID=A0A6J3M5E6_9PEZI|nr:cystathionine gamma-synthase [Dissoconium aciculare CBS 342.82]KAF1823286.1 cystathionine gamma-synthase [Dissoconium aciculare CBS 342.82]